MRLILFVGSLLLASCSVAKKTTSSAEVQKVSYELSMPNPETHYFQVKMEVQPINNEPLTLKMPVWAPGSYLIREFARNVESVVAQQNGQNVRVSKVNKNTWVVNSSSNQPITINYSVYANEISVRTSFIDQDYGYLNGTSIFMYVPQYKNDKAHLKIILPKNWNHISTGLQRLATNEFIAYNYDVLVDSPIQMGNQDIKEFDVQGISHKVAMVGKNSVPNVDKLLSDMKKVCVASTQIFGSNPCKDYTFIVQHYMPGANVNGGGLEHLNSTTLITRPDAYTTETGYRGFLSLVAHEYFHLWNVKRIRPVELGPFDYDQENYTTSLWIAEGITSYYQDKILRAADLISVPDYLKLLSSEIAGIENTPGQRVQSVAESSQDAWIKYYRQNENSRNSSISYYDKGGVLGMLLNLFIIEKTNGEKTLDDAYKVLWNKFLADGKGYSETEFKQTIESVAGASLNQFYEQYVHGTTVINYQSFFDKVGIKLNVTPDLTPSLAASVSGTKVTSVLKGGAGYLGGLNAGDEILEINHEKASDKIADQISKLRLNDMVKLKVKRFGMERELDFVLSPTPVQKYELTLLETTDAKILKNRARFLMN